MTPPTAPARDRAMLLAAAILFSTGGAAVKACAMNPWQIACLRSAIAVVAVIVLVPASRRGWSRRTFVVGAAYGATMILFVLANKLTTAANAIFLQGTAPLYVLVLSPWLLGEKIRLRQLGFMVVLAAGMACFFIGVQAPSITAPNPALGNIFGTAVGITWALCIMGLRWLGKDSDDIGPTAAAVACGNLMATIAAFPAAWPVAGFAVEDWAAVVFLGVFQIGVAYAFLVRGVARVPALEASLILLAEPVLNPLWAWLVHGEVPSAWALVGGAIFLGATIAMTLSRAGKRHGESRV